MTPSHFISIAGIAMSLIAGCGHPDGSTEVRAEEPRRSDAAGNYATVNGLKLYYEIRGEGEPLVLLFAPPILKAPYDKVAPDPKQWPTLVAKIKKMGMASKGYGRGDLKSIKASVLITLGDRDGVRVEHAAEMFRLIPGSQLAVVPGADHFLIFQNPEKLLPMIAAFFEAPTSPGR